MDEYRQYRAVQQQDEPDSLRQRSVEEPVANVGGIRTSPTERPSGVSRQTSRWRPDGRLVALALAIMILVFWQASPLVVSPLFMSTPSHTVVALVGLISSKSFATAFGSSFLTLLLGMLIACAAGITIGFVVGGTGRLGRALDPLLAFVNSTPAVTLLPLIEVWLGYSLTARVMFVVLVAVWAVAVNTVIGIRNVSAAYSDLAMAFGIKGWQRFKTVTWPAATPYVLTGIRVAMAHGIIAMIISGQEVGQSGLGGLAELAGTQFQTPKLLSVIVMTTILAIICFRAIELFRDRRYPWIRGVAESG